jgi:hypothetical protein
VSERIDVMRWYPCDPLAEHSAGRTLDPAGEAVTFVVMFVGNRWLSIEGPPDATEDEWTSATQEAKRRWPDTRVLRARRPLSPDA